MMRLLSTSLRAVPRWLAFAIVLSAAITTSTHAADDDVGYTPPTGVPFFLLADAAWGSTDEARVRLTVGQSHLEAIEAAGGVDIALYRVADPMAFLRKQRNLHRIELSAARRPDGLAPTLDHLWSAWWLRARRIWQNLFDGEVRTAVTATAPELKTPEGIGASPVYRYPSPYRALPGLTEMQRFRYPVPYAKPIAPPPELALAGSSSHFRPPQDGNVHVPLGRRDPGLYVVEASVGRQRAVTLLFVADTMAVTKTAARQFFVWTAERKGGRPVPAQVVWTDLNGVLGSGRTDADGVLAFERDVPETSYAFGVDDRGGVFISENYYYDSEIHATKLYAYTDRPLYRPGDTVHIRIQGRDFQSATRSQALPAQTLDLQVLDATGEPLFRETLAYHPENGAGTRLTLPVEAQAGGYEIRIRRGDDEYGAAFRVASYVKPNLEVHVEPTFASGNDGFRTGEPIAGRIRLAYADGQPVRQARVTLGARAQRLTMVDGDLRYGGAFPIQIDNNQDLTTDDQGLTRFTLPAVDAPSRVVLAVLAEDGAAQRVRATRELLIERAAASWTLRAARQYAPADETVRWTLNPEAGSTGASKPARWVAIHPASQTRTEGAIPTSTSTGFDLRLSLPGPYTIEVRDEAGRMLAAAPFQVTGGGLEPPQGTIAIVFDKPRYRPGETARALITFPDTVDDALLTLERDRVEQHARIAGGNGFARVRPVGDRQVEALIPVRAEHAPNITFSVASLAAGRFAFQNAGVVVEQPALAVEVRSDKAVYRPGETVTLDLQTRDADGQPAPAVLSVAVVDEMIYALQPELAPTVGEFFHHLRRNNVRTHSSQAFIAYDEAGDALVPPPPRPRARERAVKMLERPRRDERDTALFEPAIRTDAEGRASVRFVVPDALTRWRVTAKAYGRESADGLVGERRAWVQSDQPFFARWTAPDWARAGDRPVASVTVFNQTATAGKLDVQVTVDGRRTVRSIDARPGANFVSVAFDVAAATIAPAASVETRDILVELVRPGATPATVDRLATRQTIRPIGWKRDRELLVPIAAGDTRTRAELPADARDIVARVVSRSTPAWSRIADSLIDYPYGCVEQTASRLLPLSWAVRALDANLPRQSPLRDRLSNARLRLASLAGPDAVFGWWGPGTGEDLMLTAYAYLADAHASRTLGLARPPEHWEHLLSIYRDRAAATPPLQRAWALWMMQEIGLPTANLTDGLIAGLARSSGRPDAAGDAAARASKPPAPDVAGAFGGLSAGGLSVGGPSVSGPADAGSPDTRDGRDLTLQLAAMLAKETGRPWPASLEPALATARERIDRDPSLLGQAVRVAAGHAPADGEALADALTRAGQQTPTIDRALAMLLLARSPGLALGTGGARLLGAGDVPSALVPAAGWTATRSPTGQPQFVPRAASRSVSGPTPSTRPVAFDWQSAATEPLLLSLRYRSGDPTGTQALPATVERRLLRLVREGDRFRPEPVAPGSPLSTTALYLDEVTITAREPIVHALAELALPPGGLLDPTTWGIRLAGTDDGALPRATAEANGQGYAAPIDRLAAGESKTLRHLVRFAQKGEFGLPPARLWSMYAPERQATEAGPATQAWPVR